MDSHIGFLLLLQIVLIALNAIFACAEIAVLSMNETKLEQLAEKGSKRAKRLYRLTRDSAKFLATIQVAITLSGFLGSAFAADNFSEPLVDWLIGLGVPTSYKGTLDALSVIVITLVLSYFTLVFGELVPKRLAMKKSESVAMAISGIVSFISVVFKPVVWFLSVSTNLVLRICGIDPKEDEEDLSEDSIRMMVDAGSEKGTIDHQEKEFIQNVFEFNDITAGDVAIHRTDVSVLNLEDDDSAWAEEIHKTRHTKYPVADGSTDNIVGILNAKDYFRLDDRSRENVMREAVTEPYFVPENLKADVLFKNMKATRNSMAVVLDEYGGMEGIVTLFDLVEQLVGELEAEPEESKADEPCIEKNGEDQWILRGNVQLVDLIEETGVELNTEDTDTITGLAFGAMGYIPEDGNEEITVELDNIIIKITSVVSHLIEEATVTLKKNEEENEAQDE